MILLDACHFRLISRRYAVVVSLCCCALAFTSGCKSGKPTEPAASPQQPKPDAAAQAASAPVQNANLDEYHDLDLEKARFTIRGSMSDFTRDSLGNITDGEIALLTVNSCYVPGLKGYDFPIKLTSRELKDGKIRTADYGVIQVSAPGNFYWKVRMTDRQIAQIQGLLLSKKKFGQCG